ncbi:hypothetical protein FHW67_002798 [Herbaspirillum sp. Sphag1AN]|uniref:2OG-Fe(II) oxygenase n=1 Tax=unclassified Herbaspirillum TaxID=2624150 RepID=UPI00161FE412|nr:MULTISPECIES: 2OG-Fe(II) oxygenase [unclassified Herbaspirillum]MBB3213500.1 hypothetical protein [Herbaspirillum sp. Sphag1AN]MBB3246698.1 hypothetical protein [Herbaspirillum sp. Sphag64]
MEFLANLVKNELATKAYARFDAHRIFSDSELDFLSRACQIVPKERIRVGDVGEQNNLDVGRFMEDKKEALPEYRNDPLGKSVVDILVGKRSAELLREVMGGDFYIRRCQSNVLTEGSFIGKHIDTYSNLRYRYSCVIQFGEDYEGGEFFIEHEDKEYRIKTNYADFLVNRCEIPHGVDCVKNGNRTSLVFFLSEDNLSIPNTNHKQI